MLNIYIANLGKYNEGKLVGKWLELPASEDDINNLMVEIGVGYFDEDGEYIHGLEDNGVYYEEYAIHDHETDIDGLEISEYSSITELNEIAEEMEVLSEYETKIVSALLEWGVYTNVLEAIENIDDYNLNEDINNDYDLGYYWIEESGCYEIPENIKYYIDYEKFGSDISINANGFFSSNGWIEG
ncbi:antirestriction protein ArdA [Clostridium sporogenes]|uniref:antirestriction protein ArdA n=1 Tax=Clostridium sporogenes TaxID=1509 RepID=UPI002237FC6C|nr:antirestriction protein ArdA [Clostridium sporogenes]MCW6094572.1 antirestriction protein ArdA [Clostridium sporogenes]